MWVNIICGEDYMNLIWLATNMLTHEMTVDSSKSKEEVIASLKAYTDAKISVSNFNPYNSSSKLYFGHVDNSSFRIKEVCSAKLDFKPIISGVVEGKDNGASVYIRIALSRILLMLYAFIMLVIVVNSYYLISNYVQYESINEDYAYFAIFGIILILCSTIFEKIKLRTLKKHLRKIVQGPEYRDYH